MWYFSIYPTSQHPPIPQHSKRSPGWGPQGIPATPGPGPMDVGGKDWREHEGSKRNA
jgi:hypothetical protein